MGAILIITCALPLITYFNIMILACSNCHYLKKPVQYTSCVPHSLFDLATTVDWPSLKAQLKWLVCHL